MGKTLKMEGARSQRCIDPPEPAEETALTLDSDERLKWHWHDSDKLMVFIERSRLKQKEFSVLASDAG